VENPKIVAALSVNDVSSAISDLVTAAAVLIGGGWAYMKYVRGRTFHKRVRLDLAVEAWKSDNVSALLVRASMHNDGASRIELGLENEKFVRVQAIRKDDWTPDANVDWEAAEPVIRTYLFREPKWLEPNEAITDELLVPLASSDEGRVLAYRVQARVGIPHQFGGRLGYLAARAFGRRQSEVIGWVLRSRGCEIWTQSVIVPVALSAKEEKANGSKSGSVRRGRGGEAAGDKGGRRNAQAGRTRRRTPPEGAAPGGR
jgi:hypothetical protein